MFFWSFWWYTSYLFVDIFQLFVIVLFGVISFWDILQAKARGPMISLGENVMYLDLQT